MEKLKMGIVGAGVIAVDLHVDLMMEEPDRFEIVAVADPDPKATERCAQKLPNPSKQYASHTELLRDENVEAVLVAVPPYHSAQIAIDCLAAGRHVMAEKPMGNTEADARALLEASRTSKGTLMVAENFFFVPGYRRLREMARANEWPFGPPLLVTLHQFWKMTPKNIPQFYYAPWRHDERLTYGYLIEGGCHTANPLREAFGMIDEVQSRMLQADPKLGRHDTLIANAVFESGVALQLTTSYGMKSQNRHQIQVHSLEGVISVHGDHLLLMDADMQETRIETPGTHRKHDYKEEWIHFHDVIRGGAGMAFTPEQAYGDILFMQKIIDAAKT